MNRVVLMGRLTADPEVRYANGANGQTCIARYTLAVNRRFKRDGEQEADFIRCVAFGKAGEFAEKYMQKGGQYLIEGRIQTGSYMDRETGKKVYTTDIVVESQEFTESKKDSQSNQQRAAEQPSSVGDGFMDIPDDADDSFLPFA